MIFVDTWAWIALADQTDQYHVAAEKQHRRAWQMRQKYHDKPDISFIDFTSMIVMHDLGIAEVFTGDAHFLHVGLGFRLAP